MIAVCCCKTEIAPEQQHQLAWRLLEGLLWQEKKVRLSDMKQGKGLYGKPFFPERMDLHFNLTHSPHLVAAALFECPVGIDAEEIRPFRNGALRMAFTRQEEALIRQSHRQEISFFSRWCLKESRIKQWGTVAGKRMQEICYETPFSWERSEEELSSLNRLEERRQWLWIFEESLLALSLGEIK